MAKKKYFKIKTGRNAAMLYRLEHWYDPNDIDDSYSYTDGDGIARDGEGNPMPAETDPEAWNEWVNGLNYHEHNFY